MEGGRWRVEARRRAWRRSGSGGRGRARSVAWLRHAGLLLGLIAAFTAMRGTRRLESVAARIAIYLVASVFLLGIAYWYRKTDHEVRPAGSKY